MRSFLHGESSLWMGHLDMVLNSTMYWKTVDDNDDGDRYPDIKYGNAVGIPPDRVGTDLDGVFVNQDADNDGAPDTNRNLNRLPDYEEPFLMFDVEPNSYVYGLDRNNNDDPDQREDDAEVDYPYEHDEGRLPPVRAVASDATLVRRRRPLRHRGNCRQRAQPLNLCPVELSAPGRGKAQKPVFRERLAQDSGRHRR